MSVYFSSLFSPCQQNTHAQKYYQMNCNPARQSMKNMLKGTLLHSTTLLPVQRWSDRTTIYVYTAGHVLLSACSLRTCFLELFGMNSPVMRMNPFVTRSSRKLEWRTCIVPSILSNDADPHDFPTLSRFSVFKYAPFRECNLYHQQCSILRTYTVVIYVPHLNSWYTQWLERMELYRQPIPPDNYLY